MPWVGDGNNRQSSAGDHGICTQTTVAHAADACEDIFRCANVMTEDIDTPPPLLVCPLGVHSEFQLFTRGAIE
jgi:hypothetical protein